MLLVEFVEQVWRPRCERLRECTRVGYESAWNCHIAPKWGITDMGDITPDGIEDWLWDFDKPGAARKAWAVLRSILRLAVRKGCLDTDPTRREITMPHQPRYDAPVLDANEVRRLLRGFYGHELEAWLLCAVCAGLRREEACGLEWTDIDLRRGVIHIRRGLQWVDGHEVVAPPKTDLSSSDVQLPRFAVKRLSELKHGRSGRLIGDLTPPQVARRYQAWCKREQLPYVPPKSLRHTWGTLAIKSGVDISVVARQLRHTDIKTTARYYLKPDMSVLRDAQRSFERLIIG